MAKLEISESSYLKVSNGIEENGIGEIYDEKEYSKIPISQINLNTEPISIINNFRQSYCNDNIKSYISGFVEQIKDVVDNPNNDVDLNGL